MKLTTKQLYELRDALRLTCNTVSRGSDTLEFHIHVGDEGNGMIVAEATDRHHINRSLQAYVMRAPDESDEFEPVLDILAQLEAELASS